MRWVDALKIYNEGKAWCIPRKGTKEHAEVKAIMAGGAKKAEQVSEVKKIRPKIVKREAKGDDINMRLKRLKELKGKISEKKKGKVEAFLREVVEKRRAAKAKEEEKPKTNYKFRFGYSGPYDEIGVIGFQAPLDEKYKQKAKSALVEKVAKATLKNLFPTATRFHPLVVSALANPSQRDGGIEMKQVGNTVKGSLIYENIEGEEDILLDATKKALKQLS